MKVEQMLEDMGRMHSTSTVDSDLLVQMVKEVGALKIGRYYRERNLTGLYAEILLDAYMFGDVSDGKDRRANVVKHFLFGAPAHEFHLDFHLCRSWHLNVQRMPTLESDLTLRAVESLENLTDAGIICKKLNASIRMPFIQYYEPPKAKQSQRTAGGTKNAARKVSKK